MTTKISAITIGEYLEFVTVLWFAEGHLLPPEQIEAYRPYIDLMQKKADFHGELQVLKLGFRYLLSSPDLDCTRFDGGNYPFSCDEIRELVAYAFTTIWPTEELPTGTLAPETTNLSQEQDTEIEIVGDYLEVWQAR